MYGYAVMGVNPGPMLLIAIAKEAQRQLHDFGPQVTPSLGQPVLVFQCNRCRVPDTSGVLFTGGGAHKPALSTLTRNLTSDLA